MIEEELWETETQLSVPFLNQPRRSNAAWVRAQAMELDVDPRRIVIGGSSSGATLGANLGALENATAAESGKPPVIAFIKLLGAFPLSTGTLAITVRWWVRVVLELLPQCQPALKSGRL